MPIKRALLSVSDKGGLLELAKFLAERNVELISTGGTAKFLSDAGLTVQPISDFTGAPEILGGRVKTLHPKVFGGILFDRTRPQHLEDCRVNDIGAIDLVVVNLYPFEKTVAREGVKLSEAIEQIDVGGPSMIRAAAKNYKDVVVLCSPSLYREFVTEMENGEVSDEFRMRAALEVFARTAEYDRAIAEFLGGQTAPNTAASEGPTARLDLALRQVQPLRYGENPQQTAGFYTISGSLFGHGRSPFEQLQGKELSYNNLLDLDAAFKLASSFEEPSCAIIKHTNPCGSASAESVDEAIRLAIEGDPVSAFGGIIGVNRPFDEKCAVAVGNLFLEVIVAPEFSEGAVAALAKKKNLRLIRSSRMEQAYELRSAAGGVLVQATDRISNADSWKVVTKREPTDEEMGALRFAWNVCAHVKSNAIFIAKGRQSNGVGAGQMSRVDSAKLAITKSVQATEGCVAASDAFFPFRDGLDILIDAGITAVVQPGGSVRDEEVINAADERGIAMVFTGERHFRH